MEKDTKITEQIQYLILTVKELEKELSIALGKINKLEKIVAIKRDR
jgi:hypothetical protein